MTSLVAVVALASGVVLPGVVDWLSRERDAELTSRIGAPPRSWSFSFPSGRFSCVAVDPFDPDAPVYRCVPTK